MSTLESLADNSMLTMEGRQHPRFAPPWKGDVEVELPRGSRLRAEVRDMSFGGACLFFHKDPLVEIGNVLSIAYDVVRITGEVRHVGKENGKFWVGVRWLDE